MKKANILSASMNYLTDRFYDDPSIGRELKVNGGRRYTDEEDRANLQFTPSLISLEDPPKAKQLLSPPDHKEVKVLTRENGEEKMRSQKKKPAKKKKLFQKGSKKKAVEKVKKKKVKKSNEPKSNKKRRKEKVIKVKTLFQDG